MKVLVLVVFLFSPFFVFAQGILINEIAWMGSSVEGVAQNQWWRYEWLELRNASDTPVSLEGWAIELSRDKLDFRILLQGTIEAEEYFLLGASDKIPRIDLNYKNLGGKFFNGGQKVVLKNSSGEIVDEVDARNGWPAGDNETKRTMERKAGTVPALWQTSTEPGGTPRAQNSSGAEPQLMVQKDTPQEKSQPVPLRASDSAQTKKDLDRPLNGSTFFIALPGALLAGALALGARRFLLKRA